MTLALITCNQTLFDDYVANVLCFDNIQEDPVWLQEFADEFRALANDLWDNNCVTNWFLENLTFSFIEGSGITYSVTVDFTLGNLQGNGLADGMNGGSALLVSTAYTGPAPNRGRVYFTGLPETAQTDGIWAVSARNDFQTLVLAWRDGITVAGQNASLQILRRPSSKFPAYVANPVQTVSTTRGVRSQRRRNPET